jgi:hypothetical protein
LLDLDGHHDSLSPRPARHKDFSAGSLAPLPSFKSDQPVDSVFQVPRTLALPHQVEQRLELRAEVINTGTLGAPPGAYVLNSPQDHSQSHLLGLEIGDG